MVRRWSLLLLSVVAPACDARPDDAREAEIASVMARADASNIRNRPALVAGKYRRMAADLHAYHRGTLPVFAHDWLSGKSELAGSSFFLEAPLVLGTGDPHLENFGVLLARDSTLSVEPNDFDAADRMPYLWDVRRLSVGLVLAAHVSNPDDGAARATAIQAEDRIARSVAEGYSAAIGELASGQLPARVTASSNPVLADLLERSANDLMSRDELAELSEVDGGRRRLRRGVLDPADPDEQTAELPALVWEALPATLERYQRSLADPPPADRFALLDAVRIFGKGVASWARVRLLLLVHGPSDALDDDWILELRELGDSGLSHWYPPGDHYDTLGDRILQTSRAAWMGADTAPLWGVSDLLGLPVQVRLESEAQKTLRVSRLTGALGTPDAIVGLGVELGRLQARVHATQLDGAPQPARDLWRVIGRDPQGFIAEQASAGLRYAAQVRDDHRRFQRALERMGPRLGLHESEQDRLSPDQAALIGVPPEAP